MIKIEEVQVVSCPACKQRGIEGYKISIGDEHSATNVVLCQCCTDYLYEQLEDHRS
jgi:hypothetical protein